MKTRKKKSSLKILRRGKPPKKPLNLAAGFNEGGNNRGKGKKKVRVGTARGSINSGLTLKVARGPASRTVRLDGTRPSWARIFDKGHYGRVWPRDSGFFGQTSEIKRALWRRRGNSI